MVGIFFFIIVVGFWIIRNLCGCKNDGDFFMKDVIIVGLV